MSERTRKDDPSIRLLSDIKGLLILDLFTRGVKPNQIAKVLDIDPGAFSRAYPMREILGKSNNKD
jgi:hypothetical protein